MFCFPLPVTLVQWNNFFKPPFRVHILSLSQRQTIPLDIWNILSNINKYA